MRTYKVQQFLTSRRSRQWSAPSPSAKALRILSPQEMPFPTTNDRFEDHELYITLFAV